MCNVTKATYQIFIMRIFLHFLTKGFKLTDTRLKPLNLLKLYSCAQENGRPFVVFYVRTMKVSSLVHMYSTVHMSSIVHIYNTVNTYSTVHMYITVRMYCMSFVTTVFELGMSYVMAKGHKKLNSEPQKQTA